MTANFPGAMHSMPGFNIRLRVRRGRPHRAHQEDDRAHAKPGRHESSRRHFFQMFQLLGLTYSVTRWVSMRQPGVCDPNGSERRPIPAEVGEGDFQGERWYVNLMRSSGAPLKRKMMVAIVSDDDLAALGADAARHEMLRSRKVKLPETLSGDIRGRIGFDGVRPRLSGELMAKGTGIIRGISLRAVQNKRDPWPFRRKAVHGGSCSGRSGVRCSTAGLLNQYSTSRA